jgi:hypothetical protein
VILAFRTTTLIMTSVRLIAITTHLLVRLQRVALNGIIAIIVTNLVLLALMNIIMIVYPAMKAHPLILHHQHVKEYPYLSAIKQRLAHQLSPVSLAILGSPSTHL